jgi:site-specific recombinase XerD
MTSLAPILQRFFTERLAQRRASQHTIAAYRDTFRLLLRYARCNQNPRERAGLASGGGRLSRPDL